MKVGMAPHGVRGEGMDTIFTMIHCEIFKSVPLTLCSRFGILLHKANKSERLNNVIRNDSNE